MRKAVFLFVVACIVYLPTFANQFVWDDEQFITKNVLVQHISNWPMYFTTNTIAGAGLNSNYYRPLTTLSFAIDTAIWRNHTFGFHLTNLLLHAIGGVLVYVLLKKLLSLHSSSPTYDLLAYVTAFAFVLHPAQVEAVAYINSRGDSLSLVYGSLMILALMAIQKTSSDNKRILLGFASVVSFWIALLTKESAIAWAGVATLCVGLLLAKLVKVRPGVYFTAALHVISALGYLVLRFTVLQFQSTNDVWGPSSVYAHSLSTRLMTFFFVAIPQYLSILIWPLGLHMEREMKLVFVLNQIQPLSLATIGVFFLTIIAISVYMYRRRVAITHPFFLGLFLLVIFMMPFSGIMPLNGIVYEHWLYAPMIGFWLIIFSLMQRVLPKRIFQITLSVVFVIWGILSMRQIAIWRSAFTLFPNILKYTDSSRIHLDLGMAYADTQQLPQAEQEYRKTIALGDPYPQTHHNFANLYVSEGKYASAEAEYKKALAIDPTFTFSLQALTQLEIALKKKAEALEWVNKALAAFPGDEGFAALKRQASALP